MKIALVVGTRPEAIKMAGLVYALRARAGVDWTLISTGQHARMLDDTLADLGIVPDVDLAIMRAANGLSEITAAAVAALDPVIRDLKPDWLLVQGDTTTAFAAALVGFYHKVAVGHVEAGLRTGDRYSPWPEEVNRKLVSAIAARHYAPTEVSRTNLLREGIADKDVVITGNTVIDSLLHMRARIAGDPALRTELERALPPLDPKRRMILVTGHRRESFGDGFRQICLALQRLAGRDDVEIVYPVHLNPNVRGPVFELLGGQANIHLIEPLRYSRFVHLMGRAHILLTDSGGIQEEGPSLGKPVLVMRATSERPEAITAGTARLVGTSADSIVAAVARLLDDASAYSDMSRTANPYGDGHACRRIVADLLD